MATKVKASGSKYKGEVKPGKLPTNVKCFDLDLRLFKENEEQSRGMGVCPALEKKGYGVLRRIDTTPEGTSIPENEQKPSLWELLLGEGVEARVEGLRLLEENEPEIMSLANSLCQYGQMQQVGVRNCHDAEGKPIENAWDVIWGMRRVVAKAILTAKAGGPASLPPTIRCVLVDWLSGTDLYLMSLAENQARKSESPLDEAIYFNKLKLLGMNMQQIADVTGESYQCVRNRLQILDLPKEVREQIHAGEIAWTRALQDAVNEQVPDEDKDDGGSAGSNGAGGVAAPAPAETAELPRPKRGTNKDGRRRMPTIKQAEEFYYLPEKPDDMREDEWLVVTNEGFRQAIAYYAGFPYKTRKETLAILAKKQEEERAALLAETASKAAASQEKAEKKKKK